jgi:hypothetical protein
MPGGDEPKRIRLWFLGFLFRERRLQSLFSNAGKQTKPVCFLSKGHSGVSGKADIEGSFVVSRGNMGMLLWAERHPCGMPLGQRFGVIHCEALLVAPAEGSKRYLRKLSS